MPENTTNAPCDDERLDEVDVNQERMSVHLPQKAPTKKLDLRLERSGVLLFDIIRIVTIYGHQSRRDTASLRA